MNVRHRRAAVDPPGGFPLRGPELVATSLVFSALAVAVLVITGSPQDVPVVVGTVVMALRIILRGA
jgi:hypothetical protein